MTTVLFYFVELEPKYSVLTSYEPDVHYSDIQFRVHNAHGVRGARNRRQVVDNSNNNQSSTSNSRDTNTTVTPSSTTTAPSSSDSSATTAGPIKSTSTTIPPTSTDPFKNLIPAEVRTVSIPTSVQTASNRCDF